jgi:hypothetical protein
VSGASAIRSRGRFVSNDPSRLLSIVTIVTCHHHRPSARAVDLVTIVDDSQRVEWLQARFDPKLSKIIASGTLPRPAFTNPAL